VAFAALRHRSEQKRTFSQSRAHFLRHAKGNPQCAQSLDGNSDFLRIFGILQIKAHLVW